MGQAKAKQRQAALAAVGARGTAAPPPPAADPAAAETRALPPLAANRLHELFCRWQGAAGYAQAEQAAWGKGLLETCQTLGLEVPRTAQGAYDLGAVEIDFLGHQVTVRQPAPAPAPGAGSVPAMPVLPAPQEGPTEAEPEEAADGG